MFRPWGWLAAGGLGRLAACDEGYDDVGGVPVEVLAAPVVHGGCPRVSVPSGHLHFSERDACVKGGHDERRSKHVRVYQTKVSPLADRSDPAVGGAPVEALTVVAQQDGTFFLLADREIDSPSGARHQRDKSRFVALAYDPKHPVSSFEGHILDVGLTGLADPQAVQPK